MAKAKSKFKPVPHSAPLRPQQKAILREPKGKPMCLNCGTKSEQRFLKSRNPSHQYSGKQPYCKECLEQMYLDYLVKYGDQKEAFYYFCRKIDLVFNAAMFNGALQSITKLDEEDSELKTTLVGYYLKQVNGFGDSKGIGLTFDESDFFNEDVDPLAEVKEAMKTYIPPEARTRWGNVSDADIVFLETEYQDWCSRYEVSTKSMEVLIKQICYAQLRIQRGNEKSGASKADLDALQTLMGNASLKPIQETAAMGAESNTIGTMIKKFEDERPISKPTKEFEDVDGIGKLIRVFFLGHMCRMLNIDNELANEYQQEMMKYTVDIKDIEVGDD